MRNIDGLLEAELGREAAKRLRGDQKETMDNYRFYSGEGQKWQVPPTDYRPSICIVNKTQELIEEIARFMFSRPPEIRIMPIEANRQNQIKCDAFEKFIEETLEKSLWRSRLVCAGRDQMIGKRVALKVTGGADEEIKVSFRPSDEIWPLYAMDDADSLEKIIYLYQTEEASEEINQRFYWQKYYIANEKAYVDEKITDGFGRTIESVRENQFTGLSYIPSFIIINNALTGDTLGESEVKKLMSLQNAYNRMISDDMDALRFNMFPQQVFIDASPESLENIKVAPHAIIDLQTEATAVDRQASVKIQEAGFNYDARMEHHLERIESDMRSLMSVPPKKMSDYRRENTSGKALKALYWPLIARCEERWSAWDTAIKRMVRCIYDMAQAYGKGKEFDGAHYTIVIEHLYPMQEDESEERALDMREAAQELRSRESYIRKWNISEDPEDEISKIAIEKRKLEESY